MIDKGRTHHLDRLDRVHTLYHRLIVRPNLIAVMCLKARLASSCQLDMRGGVWKPKGYHENEVPPEKNPKGIAIDDSYEERLARRWKSQFKRNNAALTVAAMRTEVRESVGRNMTAGPFINPFHLAGMYSIIRLPAERSISRKGWAREVALRFCLISES